ncbi:MAG: sodium:calcium antiporter [Dehalococcoidia bacterium]
MNKLKLNYLLLLILCLLSTTPAIYLLTSGHGGLSEISASVIYGLAILGAAFLLNWGAEAAEKDISAGLALAFIAIIAVLPEYAVDFSLAWKAADDPTYAPLAIANMTGGNRLLIGIGWPLITLLSWIKFKSKKVNLPSNQKIDLSVLLVASLYAFTIPLKGQLDIIDAIFLPGIFVLYMIIISKQPSEENAIVGPAQIIADLPSKARKVCCAALFIFPAIIIFLAAEPFAHSLILTGENMGIDEFFLIQWVAPLASESPEIAVAMILTLRSRASAALTVLLSSKINQWTLLVGTLPIVYSVSSGELSALPMDNRQSIEIILTAAQSLFALVLLSNLYFSNKGAAWLFFLFITQIIIPISAARIVFTIAYIVLSAIILFRDSERKSNILTMQRQFLNSARNTK